MVNSDYLYNPTAAKVHFEKSYFVDKKLGFQVIENGTILPCKFEKVVDRWSWKNYWGGIMDSEGKSIAGTHVSRGLETIYTPPPQELIIHNSETVIYLGYFFPVWGHVITDNIRRVWFLKSELFKKEFKNCSLVYIPWYNSPLESQPNFRRLLEILEIDVDKLQPINQPTQFEKIILADESFFSDRYRRFTAEYRETIDHIRHFALKKQTPTSSKKIYYFYGRHQVGEERLATYFKLKGYEIIRPERLTLDEQLNILINCESFVSTLGSCAHNSIFLRDGTETIFIPRSKDFTGYQETLNLVHPLNVNYVDSSLSVFNVTHDWECYIISEQLKRFFGEDFYGYEEGDFKAFLEYTKLAITQKGRSINSSQEERYGSVFTDFMAQLKQHKDLIKACDMPPRWEKFQPTLTYQTHIHTKGWVAWQNEEQISGFTEDKLDIQAVKINFPNHKVYYSVYYNAEEGWSEEVSAPAQAGTTGKSKPIFGIKIRLDEVGTKEFDILYRVHKFDGTWTDWAKNGETIYSHGQKLNAIQIKLTKN